MLGRRTKNQTLREKLAKSMDDNRRLSKINSDMQNIITELESRLARYETLPDDNTKTPNHASASASNTPETPAPPDNTIPYDAKPGNIHKSAPTDYQSRTYAMSQIGKNAKSDKYSITSPMTKNRTSGASKDAQTVSLANLDGIIQDPESLHAMTLMKPEQFDYLCVKFDERVSQRNLGRLFRDDDLRASDPRTRSKLYIRHALLMSLLHKKEGIAEAMLGALFGIGQGTVSRYIKTTNSVLAEILPTARNLTSIIREIYKKRNNADAKPEPADGKDKQDDDIVGQDAKPNQDTAAERAGPRSRIGTPAPVAATNNVPAPTVIGYPTGGDDLPGMLAGSALDNRTSGQLSTEAATITDGARTPVERSKDPGLTQQDRDHNTGATRVRTVAEHVIGDIKEYALMRKRYVGTPDQYNDDLNIITGLVNLRRMWDDIKSQEDPDMISRLESWRKR